MRLPDGVLGMSQRGPDWADWVGRLPRLTNDLMAEWGLRSDGWSMHGYTALVVPALTQDDERVVLKVSFDGDDESEHEALALRQWNGRGAVRMLRADPSRRALLLERLHPTDLRNVGDLEACEVVAGLWTRLHVPAMPQLRPVTAYVERWVADLQQEATNGPVPRRLVQQATSLAADLIADPDSTRCVIHGDLHYYNVLAADREPWLAIDPKPMNGDPHYEVAPMLWNRFEELEAQPGGQGVRGGIRRRFHALVDAGGLDEDRARAWVVVRQVLNAAWAAEEDDGADEVTTAITIAKAVQD